MFETVTFWEMFPRILVPAVCVFWVIPQRFRMPFLTLVSFTFLAMLRPYSVLTLLGWSLAFYLLIPLAGSGVRRSLAPLLVLGILSYLAFFKYLPPLVSQIGPESFVANLAVPLGISYFTFKLIHYAIEVSRGNITDRSPWQFLCYMFLFPIFTAGPIERFDHFLAEQERDWHLQSTVEGLTRIIHGIIKRWLIVGGILGPMYSSIWAPHAAAGTLADMPVHMVWAGCVLTFLRVYLEFSAYTDIAIGASRLFGLRIMENFNWPIVAANIGEFWRRWHMTLAGWCQSYVYLPAIGLTRNPYVAVYATFIAIGLWHAGSLNYLCWGLYHGTGVAIFQTWLRIKRRRGWRALDRAPWRWLGVPITFLFVSGSFAFTITADTGFYAGVRVLCKLFFIELPAS